MPSRKQIETFTKIVYKYANFRIIFLYFFMSQQKLLISTLKQALKQQGLTYAQVASQIHISEPSVKRMFSSGRFTLERIEAICALMEMQLLDLMRLMERAQHSTSQLSWEQEEELIGDIRLLLLIALIRNHWSLPQILHDYAIPEHDCIQLLAQLDRLRLIELQPGNRIRLLVAPDFQWIPNGPIVRFYEERVKAEFFDASFSVPAQPPPIPLWRALRWLCGAADQEDAPARAGVRRAAKGRPEPTTGAAHQHRSSAGAAPLAVSRLRPPAPGTGQLIR